MAVIEASIATAPMLLMTSMIVVLSQKGQRKEVTSIISPVAYAFHLSSFSDVENIDGSLFLYNIAMTYLRDS